MLPPIAFFSGPKKLMRERMKRERMEAAKKQPDAAKHAAMQLASAIPLGADDIVAIYSPIKEELSPGPIAQTAIDKGATLALPVVAARKKPLVFKAYAPGDELVDGAYGAKTPSDEAPTVTPTIVIAPLLAFTRDGGRLGYGGGFYDRTLEGLRENGQVTAIGLGYAAQEVDDLPLSPLDQPLDWVVTERDAIRCNTKR